MPCVTPATKAPGPRVRPSYGRRNRSATPFPMLRTSPVGLPRISSEPTTQPAVKVQNFNVQFRMRTLVCKYEHFWSTNANRSEECTCSEESA